MNRYAGKVRIGVIAILCAVALAIVAARASRLHASNTITVNNTTDPVSTSGNGYCTLREAINNANAETDTSGGDCTAGTGTQTIVFSVSGTITLAQGPLPSIGNVLDTVTIDGTGQTITVDGATIFQVLSVDSGATMILNNLTIADGSSTGDGGGVLSLGTLNVSNSTFSGNSSAGNGGGIGNDGTLSVTNSTFYNNSATSDGGGINNSGAGTATVINSTFYGNSAVAGGAIASSGTATVTNSILDNSHSGGNCDGTISFGANSGYNISDDGSCLFGTNAGANGDTIGDSVSESNLNLAPAGLANNGGPTYTIALDSPSYAIKAIPTANCPATDQRGALRPALDSACDIGAFEFQAPRITPYNIVFTYSTFLNSGTTTTPPRYVTVVNNYPSGLPLSFGQITATTTGTPGGPVSVSPSPNFKMPSDTCSNQTLLTHNQTCTVGVNFTATAVGGFTGTLNMPSNAFNSPNIVGLWGTGIAGLIDLPATMVFPSTLVGHTTATAEPAKLYNPNAVAMTISSVTPTGDFSIVSDGCSGTPLPAKSSCTVTVKFAPTVHGIRTGTLQIVSNARNATESSPGTIKLQGTGTLSPLTFSPTAVSFGKVTVNTTSGDKELTVTNKNTYPVGGAVAISSITPSKSVFSVDSTTCGSSLAPQTTCNIYVKFTPTATGIISATLNIVDNAGNGTQKAGLNGTGK